MNPDLATAASCRAVVLVEGMSDKVALETLAARQGRPLYAEGVVIVAMGGATNIARFLDMLGPNGLGIRVAGLCDAAEESYFRRAVQRAGLGSANAWLDMAALGFHVCCDDLEDELIRALGTSTIEQVIESQGELGSFRTFQKQPAHQGERPEVQLHRFMGTRSGRKASYAQLLMNAVDLARTPPPLERVLACV